MKLAHMSWDEAVKKCRGKIILVPHGSTEEHGYHLPLRTDALVAEKICEIFFDSKEVVVSPIMNYTGVKTTKQMPGTIGPNPEEYELWLKTIIYDFMKLEPKKIFFFLAHDGNTQRNFLNKMKLEYGEEKISYLGCSSLDRQAYEIGITESTGHAGEGETSLILFLDSKNVKMEKASDQKWIENNNDKKISRSGVDGKPTKATVQKGRKLVEFYRNKLEEALNTNN
jgi:creatinine amidohydrolase